MVAITAHNNYAVLLFYITFLISGRHLTDRKSRQQDGRDLTTMRFHMRAASATRVDTELQPGISTILMGSVYSRSYSSLVASPGSHCAQRQRKQASHTETFTLFTVSKQPSNIGHRGITRILCPHTVVMQGAHRFHKRDQL